MEDRDTTTPDSAGHTASQLTTQIGIPAAHEAKIALVTGASRGIGKAIAETLARNDIAVLINHLPTQRADADNVVHEIEDHGGTALAAPADIAEPTEMRGLFDLAEEQFGQLDILILNAADVRHATLVDTTDEQFDTAFAVNTRSSFVAMREAALRLRDNGRIIVISAGLAISPREGTGAYAASKAATNHLARVLAKEVGHRGITVNSILPGAVHTQPLIDAGPALMAAEIAQTPLGRLGQPQDIADIVELLISDQASWITGQLIGAGGGMF